MEIGGVLGEGEIFNNHIKSCCFLFVNNNNSIS